MTTKYILIPTARRVVEDVIYSAAGELWEEDITYLFILHPEDLWFADIFEFRV